MGKAHRSFLSGATRLRNPKFEVPLDRRLEQRRDAKGGDTRHLQPAFAGMPDYLNHWRSIMNATAHAAERPVLSISARADASRPVFAYAALSIAVLGGTAISFGDQLVTFDEDRILTAPELEAGQDYEIALNPDETLTIHAAGLADGYGRPVVGGFHYAPGGCASSRAGGSTAPAINPFSIWDQGFRPACLDPRGMVLVTGRGVEPFWADIYLTARDHMTTGTSRFGAEIADGYKALPGNPAGGEFDKFDYAAAQAVAGHHGKRLMSFIEFATAAYGVTEKSADEDKAKSTGLSAPRTSKFGLMQATGQRWVWGTDGDPDEPRASIFGGSWIDGSNAGSRRANLDYWPENSDGGLGLRLASDHLTTV